MKVLLISDVPPCKNFSGGLVLEQLCKFLPRGTLCCFAVVNTHLRVAMSPDLSGVPVIFRPKPNENWAWLPAGKWWRYVSAALGFLGEWHVRHRRVTALIREAIEFGREQNVDRVWMILQGQTMIRMAAPVAEGLGVPLHTQVWDSFSWWIKEYRLDRWTARQTSKLFDDAICRSASCATASSSMSSHYEKRYGVRAVQVVSSHDRSMARTPDVVGGIGETLTIGMAGQFYASEEWSRLIHALKCADWKVAGRSVQIIVIGPQAPPNAPTDHVEYLGWKSQMEAADIMSDCDVLYCPYPFDAAMKEVSQYSFPSKLVLYLAAGRPVLFHGPTYSAPSHYVRQNRVGVNCSQLAASAVYNELERLARTPSLYESLARNAQAAFLRDFTLESMSSAFKSFLDFGTEDTMVRLYDHRHQSGPQQPTSLSDADRQHSVAFRSLQFARKVAAKYPFIKDVYRKGITTAARLQLVNRTAPLRVALKKSIRRIALRIPRLRNLYHEIHSLYQQKAALQFEIAKSHDSHLRLKSRFEQELHLAKEKFARLESKLQSLEVRNAAAEEQNVRLRDENSQLHSCLGIEFRFDQSSRSSLIQEGRVTHFVEAAEFFAAAREMIIATDVVLDIGCGIRPQSFFRPRVHLCVEPFDEYVRILQNRLSNVPGVVVIKLDALGALLQLPGKSVDSIFMLDVIEHLDKATGLTVLRECDRVARRQISVFTPLGFMPQEYSPGEKDAWGLSGTDQQTHLSGWLPEDFGETWSFLICDNYHRWNKFHPDKKQNANPHREWYGALWAIKTFQDQRPKLCRRTLFIGRSLPPASAPTDDWIGFWTRLSSIDPASFGCVTSMELSPFSAHLQVSETRLAAPYSYISFSVLDNVDAAANWANAQKLLPHQTIRRITEITRDGQYEAICGIVIEPSDAIYALSAAHKCKLPVTLLTLESERLSGCQWISQFPGSVTLVSPSTFDLS